MFNIKLILVIGILTIVYLIHNNVTKQLTVQSYVTTNYMYIFGALLLMILTNNVMEEKNIDIDDFYGKGLLLLILGLFSLFGVILTSNDHQLIKHLFWLVFILTNSVVIYPMYKIAKDDGVIWKVLITLGVMFIALSYIAYTKPVGYFEEWSPYLFIGLCSVLVFRLLDLVFASPYSRETDNRNWWYSILAIIIFTGYMLYDTQRVVKDGKILNNECVGKDHLVCADYPSRSLALFLDMINLFANVTNVYRKYD